MSVCLKRDDFIVCGGLGWGGLGMFSLGRETRTRLVETRHDLLDILRRMANYSCRISVLWARRLSILIITIMWLRENGPVTGTMILFGKGSVQRGNSAILEYQY